MELFGNWCNVSAKLRPHWRVLSARGRSFLRSCRGRRTHSCSLPGEPPAGFALDCLSGWHRTVHPPRIHTSLISQNCRERPRPQHSLWGFPASANFPPAFLEASWAAVPPSLTPPHGQGPLLPVLNSYSLTRWVVTFILFTSISYSPSPCCLKGCRAQWVHLWCHLWWHFHACA